MSGEWTAPTILTSLAEAAGRTIDCAVVSTWVYGTDRLFMRFTDGAVLALEPQTSDCYGDGDVSADLVVYTKIRAENDLGVADACRLGLCRDHAHYYELYEAHWAAERAKDEAEERRQYEALKAKYEGGGKS